MRLTNENWQTVWQTVQVKADMSVANIQEFKTPEISTVNRGTGSTDAGIELYEWVVLGVLEFVGVEWTVMQIRECAELLFSEYYWMQIAELKHLITKIKTGSFGKIYGKLNPLMLQEFFKDYALQSMEEREQAAIRKANDERYEERWGAKEARYIKQEQDGEIYKAMQHEKAKLNNNGADSTNSEH